MRVPKITTFMDTLVKAFEDPEGYKALGLAEYERKHALPPPIVAPPIITLSPEDAQWLTGFWEGDGTINGKATGISFAQKDTKVLDYIAGLLGLKEYTLGGDEGARQLVVPRYKGSNYLLLILLSNLVSERRFEQIKRSAPDNSLIPNTFESHKTTLPWLAGFFDAEGSVDLGRCSVVLSIQQREAGVLLRLSKEYPGSTFHTYVHRAGFSPGKEISVWSIGGEPLRAILPSFVKLVRFEKKKAKLLNSICLLSLRSKVWKTCYERLSEEWAQANSHVVEVG